jgi:Na+/H+-translocating membrane pyrophosphatase
VLTLHIATNESVVAISAAIAGVIAPALIAVINQPRWQSQTKRIIAYAGAAVIGLLTVIGNGAMNDLEVNLPNAITVIMAVVGASQIAYGLLWKPSGMSDMIEEATSPKTPVPPAPPEVGGA